MWTSTVSRGMVARVLSPHVLDDRGPVLGDPSVPEEELEQGVFLGGQVHGFRPLAHLVSIGVERDVPGPKHWVGDGAAPPEERAHPGHQLLHVEGFDQIVVGPGVEPLHHVPFGAAGREDEHRGPASRRAQPAADLETMQPRQVEIQDDAVLLVGQPALQPLGAVETYRGGVVLQFQVAPDVVGQSTVVFDDEDLHSASRPFSQARRHSIVADWREHRAVWPREVYGYRERRILRSRPWGPCLTAGR